MMAIAACLYKPEVDKHRTLTISKISNMIPGTSAIPSQRSTTLTHNTYFRVPLRTLQMAGMNNANKNTRRLVPSRYTCKAKRITTFQYCTRSSRQRWSSQRPTSTRDTFPPSQYPTSALPTPALLSGFTDTPHETK